MRLLDASDDDALVTQAWGEAAWVSAWVEVGRQLRALTDAWYARRGLAPWAEEIGPRCLVGLVMGAIARSGGALVQSPEGLRGYVGTEDVTLSTVAAWSELAAYDPDEGIRALVQSGLLDAGGKATLVALLHHTEVSRVEEGVRRFKALPLAGVERLSASGVRVDVFPAWGAGVGVPGFTVLVAR